ncbi:caldesmon-like isoform X1 [Periplaneta americana]|uniref:caldesmon-like isoform X1 n=1 Tax=Periplaneta americana TaxID=6978 RepID=UPI0037E96E90
MEYRNILLAFLCLGQSLFVQCTSSAEYGAQFKAALAAQVAANRAAIAGTLADKYWAQARAEHTISIDHMRRSREKAYFSDVYKKRAQKLEEVARKEEIAALDDKKQARLLEENTQKLRARAREIESKAKIKENLAVEYRSKAKEQYKEAQLAEIASREAKTKAEEYENTASISESMVADLEKSVDSLHTMIRRLRKKVQDYTNKATYEKAVSVNHLKRAIVYKKNAGEYERAARETIVSAKELQHLAMGLYIQAEEERSKIKVEDVKAKYDKYISQLFQSQASDNRHFADTQFKESKFYESRAKIARTRSAAYRKTAQEIRKTALAGLPRNAYRSRRRNIQDAAKVIAL